MKAKDMNPKAREAFGKTLIDIGVSIYKSIMLLILVFPITIVLKSALEGTDSTVSIYQIINSFSVDTQYTLIFFISIAVIAAELARNEGLRHIHEVENKT